MKEKLVYSSYPVPITYASPVCIPLVALPTSQQYSTSCQMVNGMGHPGVVANAPTPLSALLLEDKPNLIFNMTAPPDIHCDISASRTGLSDGSALGVDHFMDSVISRSEPP